MLVSVRTHRDRQPHATQNPHPTSQCQIGLDRDLNHRLPNEIKARRHASQLIAIDHSRSMKRK